MVPIIISLHSNPQLHLTFCAQPIVRLLLLVPPLRRVRFDVSVTNRNRPHLRPNVRRRRVMWGMQVAGSRLKLILRPYELVSSMRCAISRPMADPCATHFPRLCSPTTTPPPPRLGPSAVSSRSQGICLQPQPHPTFLWHGEAVRPPSTPPPPFQRRGRAW